MQLRPILAVVAVGATLCLTACAGPTKAGLEAREEAHRRLATIHSDVDYDQAMQAYEGGQFEKALKSVEGAIRVLPDAAHYEVLRGRIYLEMNKLQNSIQSFLAAIEKDPKHADAYYYAGIVFQRWSDDEQAYEHYTSAYELETDNVQYLLASAEALLALGELDPANELIEQNMQYFEHSSPMRQLLGQIALLQRDPATAARLYQEARMLDPENDALLEELALAEYDAGFYSKCYNSLELLKSHIDEERVDLDHLRARCLFLMDRAKDAYRAYVDLSSRPGIDPSVFIEFGTLAWQLGDYRRVAECSVRIIDSAPDRFEGLLLKGVYERHEGRIEEAVSLFMAAAEVAGEESVLPQLMLGRTLEEADQDHAALTVYAEAMRIDPQNQEARQLHEAALRRMQLTAVAE